MRQIPSFCPNCDWQYVADVCGGDFPYWRRYKDADLEEGQNLPNVYFVLDLETEQPVKAAADWEGLDLGEFDDLDYKEMLEHAQANGCLGEPICITCGQPLVWEYKGMNQIETNDLVWFDLKKLPDGTFENDYDGNNPSSVKQIADELHRILRCMVPGSYIIQIWTKECYDKEYGHEQQPNTE